MIAQVRGREHTKKSLKHQTPRKASRIKHQASEKPQVQSPNIKEKRQIHGAIAGVLDCRKRRQGAKVGFAAL